MKPLKLQKVLAPLVPMLLPPKLVAAEERKFTAIQKSLMASPLFALEIVPEAIKNCRFQSCCTHRISWCLKLLRDLNNCLYQNVVFKSKLPTYQETQNDPSCPNSRNDRYGEYHRVQNMSLRR
jgi:hypothetical protein